MIDRLARTSASLFWRITRRARQNRDCLNGGMYGLRSITFHDIPERRFADFQRIIRWCQSNLDIAQPEDAANMLEGLPCVIAKNDAVLITFDDGHADNYRAAEWLHKVGIKAVFFIVPSFVGRTNTQYIEYHRSRGVAAYPLQVRGSSIESSGLSRSQVSEILAMGHVIGAHNYAHRDLGALVSDTEVEYEIRNAIESVEDLTGMPCRDFAVGFGQPNNLSAEAIRYIEAQRCRTYMCFRGLNLPGRSPRYFLRHAYFPAHPISFTTLCLQGGVDHMSFGHQESMISRVGTMPTC